MHHHWGKELGCYNQMQAISNFLKDNEKTVLAVSAATLAAYLLLRQTLWANPSKGKRTNLLDVTLSNLIANQSHAHIKKIVITTSSSSKGNFRKTLIDFLKYRLTQEGVKVLINCSPQKLLTAGCECFLESMQSDDSEYLQYYYNALKTQYLIEDTISNIELINEGGNHQIVMICDNNPFDIKLLNRSDQLWSQFLKKIDVTEQQISDGYDFVIHVIEKDSVKEQDERIQRVWSGKQQYHQIKVFEQDRRENFEFALCKIQEYLAAKERPI